MSEDPRLVVRLDNVMDEFLARAKEDPSLYGKNAERLRQKATELFLTEDGDLGQMSRAELLVAIKKLRAGIRAHRDAEGHNLCWWVPELWNLLPEAEVTPSPKPPPTDEFLACCRQYRASLDAPASGESK